MDPAVLESRFAAIVESSQDAILSKDLDGTITSWNAAAERLYGYRAEEIVGRPVDLLLIDPAERERIFTSLAAGRRLEPYETRRRHQDGSVVDISVSISPVRDGSGEVIGAAAIARDISGRKHDEQALRRSELRYRTLVSQLPDSAVCLYDRDLRIVAAEGTLLEQDGPSPETLCGRSLWDLVPDARAHTLAAELRSALDGRPSELEWESVERGMILDLDVVPVREDDGTIDGVLVLARDVSTRRRIERGLHFQAQLLDRLDVAVVASDLAGRITHWNRAAEAIFERPAATTIGRPLADLLAEYRIPDAAERRAHNLEGETVQYVHELARRDGSCLPVLTSTSAVRDEDGAAVGFTGVVMDITEQLRAAEALRFARELFESAFERAPTGMLLVDCAPARLGRLLRVNRAVCEMLERDDEALVGTSVDDIVHADDRARVLPGVERVLAGLNDGLHDTVRLIGPGGRILHTELRVSLIRDGDGEPLRAVVLVHDVTRARQDQADKAALEVRLQQSAKLEGIGRLAGGIAHDFNNLLAVIRNYADLVADELPRGDLRADVEQVVEAADRAAALTRQLLVFASREVVQPRPLDLRVVVADTERLLRRTIGEDVELRTEQAGDGCWVLGDRSQLEQVLLNLAINARDAMPTGGRLTITTGRRELEGHAAQRLGLTPGPYAAIDVADTGHGMAPDVTDLAFEPFFTTKPRGTGTGLGLATVYGIVTKAGGDVRIASAPGSGTTVSILLPATAEAALSPTVPGAAPPPGRGERVLVVEDEGSVRALVARILSDAGYLVAEAGDRESALSAAADATPDLVVTDVVMPGMSGTDLAGELDRRHPGVRVLFMSGYTDDVVMRHGIRDRRLSFLEKPFTRRDLLTSVSAQLDRGARAA